MTLVSQDDGNDGENYGKTQQFLRIYSLNVWGCACMCE